MPEITLPPTHNKRAPEQWDIISQHVDFRGKTVLDLGCGYADLLWRCWVAGAADWITGADKDKDIITNNRQVGPRMEDGVYFFHMDINKVVAGEDMLVSHDVVLCFSALSYLDSPKAILEWIYNHSHIALLEIQCFGDGLGLAYLRDDADVRCLLEGSGWTPEHIALIGSTFIPGRDKLRTIWLCGDKETLWL